MLYFVPVRTEPTSPLRSLIPLPLLVDIYFLAVLLLLLPPLLVAVVFALARVVVFFAVDARADVFLPRVVAVFCLSPVAAARVRVVVFFAVVEVRRAVVGFADASSASASTVVTFLRVVRRVVVPFCSGFFSAARCTATTSV